MFNFCIILIVFLVHSSPQASSEVESISKAFQAALAILSPNSTTSSSPSPPSLDIEDPSSSLASEVNIPETTTDVYARALRYLDKRQKERRRRGNGTSYVRPRINRIRANERLQLETRIQDARNITKRIDDKGEVSDQEIDQITDVMANLTLGSPGEGRSSGSGRSMDGFSSIFTRFTKVLDLGRVVREIETSVMTSVSCTACRAG